MSEKNNLPIGVVVLKTLAMPKNTNANGDIFGGWIMSQMDMGGAILAKEISGEKVVTVRVDAINFFKSVSVGDIVTCYANCIKIGKSSIKINVEIWIKKIHSKPLGQYYCAAVAEFIYVAIDKVGKPLELLPMSLI
ncbi:Ycia [Buchnera aphidicola str. G002 (Myzus persicae)]|uniref:Ycia n=1 Tax=Buchnera aphidicola str. USDA (Myzus persicae) TaxID=1009856 RepID=W0P4W5_BUCMP|nr:acyl-CoA thioester hydrolase YciA [Buchnera aphidicola]AHG60108.1 Ycia [Buchnera aphidicola str. USDA (Myzus persicae)]AHG60688.1 Ycia [Buchnera aphidicola str. W106 (Myzus persicae)]AHG61260.1 Ycia [Buchnera aphidicola str. G002 (Myzus persicae)]WAI03203.1 MAG: acyl-CoA thioester hydrolase YciA [Buchnera aphidicola (Myzus persicae)]